tara:strand:+ start:5199 stop:5705 length:507 start_codon:yes stop_codon:yes gene_type:complete
MDIPTANKILEFLSQEPVPPIEEAPILLQQLMSSAATVNIAVVSVICFVMAFIVVGIYISDKRARQILDRNKIKKGDYQKLDYKDKPEYLNYTQQKWIFGAITVGLMALTAFPFTNLAQINNAPHRWLYEEVTNFVSFNGHQMVDGRVYDRYKKLPAGDQVPQQDTEE